MKISAVYKIVYKIVNTITNDFYVESSKNAKERWINHRSPSTWKKLPNSQLYKDMQKYGVDKFDFQILAIIDPEYLKETEQQFIEKLKPTYNKNKAKGFDVERQKKYQNQLCSYNGETLTLGALAARFRRTGIKHPTREAGKYINKI